jgi:hypothetical protein
MEPITVLVPVINYPQRSSRTAFAIIDVVFQQYDNGELKSIYTWREDSLAGLAKLSISCQIDGDSISQSYAWKLGYKNYYTLELNELELMCKTLRPITKKYEKLVQNWFQPQTFGNYALVVARSANIKYFSIPSDCGASLVSLLDGANWIDNKVEELKQKCVNIQAEKTA